jgi:hypothetical protein
MSMPGLERNTLPQQKALFLLLLSAFKKTEHILQYLSPSAEINEKMRKMLISVNH